MINIILGSWLFLSAFAWDHLGGSRTNTWVVGLLIVLASSIATVRDASRVMNTALGAWLLLSTLFVFRSVSSTFWNNVVVAVLVFVVSLVPTWREPHRA